MKSTQLVRALSWLVLLALVGTMAPPALSFTDGAKREDAVQTDWSEVIPAGAAAEPLTIGAALDVVPLRASQVVSDSASLSATAPLTTTAPLTVTAPLTGATPLPALPEAAGESTAPPVLTMTADPFQVTPGGVITYSVAISNVADAPLLRVVLSDPLPAGVVYVAESAVGFSYSPRDGRLTWAIDQIEPGEGLRGGFQLRATGLGIGALITNTVSASSANAPLVTASAMVEVAPPRQDRVWATPGQGGWLRSEDGRVDLRAPAGAVQGRTELRYSLETNLELPEHLFYAFSLQARDSSGQAVTQFGRPMALSAFFDPRQLPPGALERLALFYLDKNSGDWHEMSSTIDPNWRRVVTAIDRLEPMAQSDAEVTGEAMDGSLSFTDDEAKTTYAFGTKADLVEDFIVERMSSLRGAQTNLFSLSIGYSYPIEMLPGRGGLTPLLALNYSSANHTPASGHHSVVGFGWELAGADYVYTPPGDPNLGKVTLSLQGRAYSLRAGANGKWYAVEDPFMKVEPGNWSHATAGSWTIWTRDGTRYSFFDEPYPSASHYWKICQGCTTGKRYVRIPLREIEDTSGNKIHLTWAGETSDRPCDMA